MLRIVLVLAAAVLFGCNSTESHDNAKVSAGIYLAELSSSNGSTISIEENLENTGAYRGRMFLEFGGKTCALADAFGEWAHHEKGFSTKNVKAKTRNSCDEEFSASEDIPDEVAEIRKVTPAGYEEYFEMDNQPAIWLVFKRI